VSTRNEPVEIELDLSTISVSDLEGEGSPPPGKYHAKIEDVQRVSDQTSYLKVRFALLAGTDPNGVGCLFSERFYLSDKAKKRLAILAHRLKLISEDDFGDRRTVDWDEAIGRQLIVQVVEEEYEAKSGGKAKRAKLAFAGFWDVADDRVKDVPRDPSAARQASAPKRNGGGKKPPADEWEAI
jgi:hypothetical protein